MTDDLSPLVAEARHAVRQVSSRLLTPSVQTLDECGSALERAVQSVTQLQRRAEAAHNQEAHELKRKLMRLAQEIGHAGVLLSAAGRLYFGSLRPLMASGLYNAQGGPEPPPTERQLSIAG